MKRFLDSRNVILLKRPKDFYRHFDKRAKDESRKYLLEDASHLNLGQNPDLKLMPFQVCAPVTEFEPDVTQNLRLTDSTGSSTIGGYTSTAFWLMRWAW
jgi:hypothetical protein